MYFTQSQIQIKLTQNHLKKSRIDLSMGLQGAFKNI